MMARREAGVKLFLAYLYLPTVSLYFSIMLAGECLSKGIGRLAPAKAEVSPYASTILLAGAVPSRWPIWSCDDAGSLSATFSGLVTPLGIGLRSFGLPFACDPCPMVGIQDLAPPSHLCNRPLVSLRLRRAVAYLTSLSFSATARRPSRMCMSFQSSTCAGCTHRQPLCRA